MKEENVLKIKKDLNVQTETIHRVLSRRDEKKEVWKILKLQEWRETITNFQTEITGCLKNQCHSMFHLQHLN